MDPASAGLPLGNSGWRKAPQALQTEPQGTWDWEPGLALECLIYTGRLQGSKKLPGGRRGEGNSHRRKSTRRWAPGPKKSSSERDALRNMGMRLGSTRGTRTKGSGVWVSSCVPVASAWGRNGDSFSGSEREGVPPTLARVGWRPARICDHVPSRTPNPWRLTPLTSARSPRFGRDVRAPGAPGRGRRGKAAPGRDWGRGAPAPLADPARVLRPPRPPSLSPPPLLPPPLPPSAPAVGSVFWHFLQPGRAAS